MYLRSKLRVDGSLDWAYAALMDFQDVLSTFLRLLPCWEHLEVQR